MDKEFQLSSIDMMTFLIQALIGIRVLTLPRVLAGIAATDSWISVILGGFLTLGVGLALYWLGIKHPGLNGSEITLKLMGNVMGKLGLILIAIHVGGAMALSIEIYSNSVRLFLLNKTPYWVISGAMLFLGLYATIKGLKTIASMVNILLPQLLFFMVLLLILPYKRIDPQNILPLYETGVMPIGKGALEVFDTLYEITIISYIMPYFKERKDVFKWIFPGVIIPVGIYLGIVTIGIMVFGAQEMTRMVFPTISLAKSIELEGRLLERAESLFMIVWTIVAFFLITFSFYVGYLNLRAWFPNKKKILIYGQLPFVLLLIAIPKNVAQVKVLTEQLYYLGRFIMLGLVPVLVILTLVKERRERNV